VDSILRACALAWPAGLAALALYSRPILPDSALWLVLALAAVSGALALVK
jgi:hypothetical protein